MVKKKDDKKIGAIRSSQSTKGVKATESVRGVSGVSRVSGTGALGAITLEQRDKLLSLVSEEAEKLTAQGVIPKSQREVVEQAVKMVIDASLIEASNDNKNR